MMRSYGNMRAPRPEGCALRSSWSRAACSSSSGGAVASGAAAEKSCTRACSLRPTFNSRAFMEVFHSFDQPELFRGRNDLAGDRRCRAVAITCVLDDHGEGDPPSVALVWRESGEPRVRGRTVDF